MTELDLANKTGINKKVINEIIKGKDPITNFNNFKTRTCF